jgi:predicted anti-sigma-YlaC factor YlaD
MDQVHRLNEGEIVDALAGQPPEERIADCESCAEEFSAWAELGDKLRRDLESRADLPAYFWMRQQARIRERLAPRATQLRWAAAAIFALILVAFALIHQSVAPRSEVAQITPPAVAHADPDDVLLENVHASLQREVPAPLAPAAMLVEEMASASNQAQQTKEN